jgi:hypothetical protein
MGVGTQISTHRRYPLPPHTSLHLGFLPTRLPYQGLPSWSSVQHCQSIQLFQMRIVRIYILLCERDRCTFSGLLESKRELFAFPCLTLTLVFTLPLNPLFGVVVYSRHC